MKMKTQLSLAAIFLAGLITSGCSQMSAQQVAQAVPAPAPTPGKVITITDCSKCPPRPRSGTSKGGGKKPGKRGGGLGGRHSHPAIPGCTNSITHSHPYTNARHSHSYSCKGRKLGKRPGGVRPPMQQNNKWGHTHPAIPGCTDSITHSHPYNNANHSHHYSCKGGQRPQYQQQQQIIVPPIKAKGNFKGPIQIDQSTMKQYQQ